MLYDATGKNYNEVIQRLIECLLALGMVALPLSAKDNRKEADRLENCGTVLKEILDIPDDIPQDLLDKAECVIIFSVGSQSGFYLWRKLRSRCDNLPLRRTLYGSLGCAYDDGAGGRTLWFAAGGQATAFVLARDEPARREGHSP